MINSTYVGISAQLALQRRLDTIANNIANATTAGFRAELVRFATVSSTSDMPNGAYAATGQAYLSQTAGEVVRTDNPLDVAVDGDAWLAIETPQGMALSRDGRLQITPTGELRTLTGHAVLDVGGSPLLLDPAGGPPEIARNGAITQAGTPVGSIGLFILDPAARLQRGADASVLSDIAAQPAVDTTLVGVRQGFVERANVNPVTEMARLVLDQRMFEAVTSALGETEQTMQDAIRALGTTT